jgi:hypothetical protein
VAKAFDFAGEAKIKGGPPFDCAQAGKKDLERLPGTDDIGKPHQV